MKSRTSRSKVQRVIADIYAGMSQHEAAQENHTSSSVVNKIWRQHEEEVQQKGLLPTLREGGQSEAYETALLGRELKKNDVTVSDCKSSIPIAKLCREHDLEGNKAAEFVENAIQLATPGFPRSEFAQSIVRYSKLEKQTGLTLDQLEAAYQNRLQLLAKARNDYDEITKKKEGMEDQFRELSLQVGAKTSELVTLDNRLKQDRQTDASLAAYQSDKTLLAGYGLDIADITKLSIVLDSIQHLNYNPIAVVNTFQTIGNLTVTIGSLLRQTEERQSKVNELSNEATKLVTEIQALEKRRSEADEIAEITEEDANGRIDESNKRIQQKLSEENTTMNDLEEYKTFKTQLVEANIKPDDTQMICQILDEVKRLGNPAELTRQLNLNVTLEQRQQGLETQLEGVMRTRKDADKELGQRIDQIRKLTGEREQLLAEKIRTEKESEAEKARFELERDQMKKDLVQLDVQRRKEVVSADWLLAVITRNPEILRKHKSYLTYLMEHDDGPPKVWTEEMAYGLINLAREDLTSKGLLIPAKELDAAKKAVTMELALARLRAENASGFLNRLLQPIKRFNKYPDQLTARQKGIVLEAFAQSGAYTYECFKQLMKKIEGSEKCAAHGTPMVFDYVKREWTCPTSNCTFRR